MMSKPCSYNVIKPPSPVPAVPAKQNFNVRWPSAFTGQIQRNPPRAPQTGRGKLSGASLPCWGSICPLRDNCVSMFLEIKIYFPFINSNNFSEDNLFFNKIIGNLSLYFIFLQNFVFQGLVS